MATPDPIGCNLLRAGNASLGEAGEAVEFRFEDRIIRARKGESLLAALVASGELRLRVTANGEFRGPFCGMGVCQECLLEVNGRCSRRACMTMVAAGMTVRRQANRVAAAPMPLDTAPVLAKAALTPLIAVIGGGPAGMAAAAVSAEAGADVVLIDERAQPGGQYFKQPLAAGDLQPADFDDRQYAAGRALIGRLRASGARHLPGTRVAGVFEPMDLVASTGAETRLVRPQILILATGAFEICYPFNGWTLPGVMTTGAAQTLLRSYRVLPGRRVVVAGNGPLNFQLATELARSGAEIVAVIEASRRPGLSAIGPLLGMMKADGRLAAAGAGYLASLARHGVPLVHGRRVVRIESSGHGDRPQLLVTAACLPGHGAEIREFEADAVCLGYGFRPANELLRALGCAQRVSPTTGSMETVRDNDCMTTRDRVFAVGDCTRLGGAVAAQAEGIVAAAAALRVLGVAMPAGHRRELDGARAMLRRQEDFQRSLWRLFRPAGNLFAGLDDQALVCRCAEVSLAELNVALATKPRAGLAGIKRLTRIGMGRCQGRYCAATLERIQAGRMESPLEEVDLWAPRPPVGKTRIAELASLEFPPQQVDG